MREQSRIEAQTNASTLAWDVELQQASREDKKEESAKCYLVLSFLFLSVTFNTDVHDIRINKEISIS